MKIKYINDLSMKDITKLFFHESFDDIYLPKEELFNKITEKVDTSNK